MMGGSGMNTLGDESVNDISQINIRAYEHGRLMLRADPDLVQFSTINTAGNPLDLVAAQQPACQNGLA